MVDDYFQHRVEAWVTQGAARIGFDRHPRADDRVRVAEGGYEPVEIRSAAKDLEKSPLAVETIVGASEPPGSEVRRHDAVFAGARDVERLRHRAEVGADAAGHARRNRQHVAELLIVQLHQFCRGGSGAKRADRTRGVKAPVVVIRIDRLGDLALDFEADEERFQKCPAGEPHPLADRKRRGERGQRRMGEQSKRAIGRCRQLRVVIVHRVPACAVGERRKRDRRHEPLGPERSRFFLVRHRFHVFADNGAAANRRPSQDHADAVDDAPLGLLNDVWWNVLEIGSRNESLDGVRRPFDCGSLEFLGFRIGDAYGAGGAGNGRREERAPGHAFGNHAEELFAAHTHGVSSGSAPRRELNGLLSDIVIRFGNDIGFCSPSYHNCHPKADQNCGRDQTEIDAASSERGGRGAGRRVLDNRDRLRDGQGGFARQTRHDSPRQKHDAESHQTDDQQRMPGVFPGDHAQRRQHGGQDPEASDPETWHVWNTVPHSTVNHDPGKKCADGQRHTGSQGNEVTAHSGPEHRVENHG